MATATRTKGAYHGDPAVKAKYTARVEGHRLADEIVQGAYWDGSRGCCVGCAAHTDENPHDALERDAGLPEELSRLADAIHEGLPKEDCKSWPTRYFSAPRPGADLSLVHHGFVAWLLADEVVKYFDALKYPDVASACRVSAALRRRAAAGQEVADAEWSAAESAASSAAWSAASSAAWSAAWSAAESAASSAAWSAAESAAWSAAWSAARSSAWSAARSAAYARMADKLVELMAAA